MAQKVRVFMVDDYINDGTTEADTTIKWSFEGVAYEIDLTDENADAFRANLKKWRQASRVIGGKRPKGDTVRRPSTPQDDDTATITAWAIEKGLRKPGQRGRVANSIKEAYTASQAGDDGPLNELRALKRAMEQATAPVDQPAPPAADATPQPTPTDKSASTPGEDEAAKHYRPLTVHSPDVTKNWKQRTAHGCERTMKVEEMTLAERVNAVGGGTSDRNLTILGMLAGVVPLKNGKVSHLTGSALRLQNLEMIEYDPDSPHGWTITDFGRYAHQFHSMA